jgi:hypothetical protein
MKHSKQHASHVHNHLACTSLITPPLAHAAAHVPHVAHVAHSDASWQQHCQLHATQATNHRAATFSALCHTCRKHSKQHASHVNNHLACTSLITLPLAHAAAHVLAHAAAHVPPHLMLARDAVGRKSCCGGAS